MEAFLVSAGVVALAEIGDKTQLIALVLAARFKRPLPVIAGIVAATIVNHTIAGIVGAWLASVLGPTPLRWILGLSFVAIAVWLLVPDKVDSADVARGRYGIFVTTLITFFLAEMGDKTQIATAALAAGYPNLFAVIGGSTAGLMLVNLPAVFIGKAFEKHLPMRAIHVGAAILFGVLGVLFLARSFAYFAGSP